MMTLSQSSIKDDFVFAPYLVLYLPLHELDGASFMSKDAYGHLCTRSGAFWTPQGWSFDRTDDMITLPSTLFPDNNFTVVVWFKSTASGQFQALFTTQDEYYMFLMLRNDTNKLEFNVGISPVNKEVLSNNALAGDGHWHCAIGVKSSIAGMTLDIDGVLQTDIDTTATGNLDTTPNGRSLIGRYCSSFPTYQYPYGGLIGEAIFYARPLLYLERQAIYLATKWRYR